MGQYNGDEEMKDAADAALYRDPYERKYSMRYAEPDHDYKGWNTDKPTEPKPTKEQKTPRPTWQKTPRPTEHKSNYGHGQWEKDNDYKYKEEMKKAADASYYRDPYAREYSMQYDQMKNMADAAYYRDPYERRYSMRFDDNKEMKKNADAAYYRDPYERRYD